MTTEASAHLAANLLQLRDRRGWTQSRLAEVAGVPRATLATAESGGANPTLAVLVRLATALQVSLDELVGPPRATARRYAASELRSRVRRGVEVRELIPDTIPGVVVERMAFEPGSTLPGVPHTPGTREYLTCERGRIELIASGQRTCLEPGDVVVFRGDQKHAYRSLDGEAVAYSVVMPG